MFSSSILNAMVTFGYVAGAELTTGVRNVIVGSWAGDVLTTVWKANTDEIHTDGSASSAVFTVVTS